MLHSARFRNGIGMLSIKEIASNIDLSGTTFVQRIIECTSGNLSDSRGVLDIPLVFGNGAKDRELVTFLESAHSFGIGTAFRSDSYHRRVCPIRYL